MKFKTFNIYLKVISPIHIGSGEDYEPYHYVVKDGYMYLIDEDKYSEFLTEKGKFDEFLKVCDSGNLIKIRGFIFKNFEEKTSYRKIKVSKEFEQMYLKNINSTENVSSNVINRLVAKRHISNSLTGNPIISGSAIKGAIRTAILDFLAKKRPKTEDKRMLNDRWSDRKLQAYLLGFDFKNVKSDPLKFFKVSDFTLIKGKTIIDKVVNIKGFSSNNEKVPQFLELVSPNSIFEGTISIEKNFVLKGEEQSEKVTYDFLKKVCNSHYKQDVFEKEANWFKYPDFLPELSESILLKIGMHTGAYAMTIENYRDITLKFGEKKKYHQKRQTTTWKAEDVNMPLGWALLSTKPFEKNDNGANGSVNSSFKKSDDNFSRKKKEKASKEDIAKLIRKLGKKKWKKDVL